MIKNDLIIKIFLIQLIIFLIFGLYPVVSAEQWQGKVVGVSDGDTITVLNGTNPVRIRVSEIDCPENGQAYSNIAKKFTSDLCFGKVVTIVPETIDRYGRTVAHVKLDDGGDLSTELLDAGFAWHYKKVLYKSKTFNN